MSNKNKNADKNRTNVVFDCRSFSGTVPAFGENNLFFPSLTFNAYKKNKQTALV